MRKMISILLIIVMMFSMCACNSYLVVSDSKLTVEEFKSVFSYDFKSKKFVGESRSGSRISIVYKDDLDYNVYEIILEQYKVDLDSIDSEMILDTLVNALMTQGYSAIYSSGTEIFMYHMYFILDLIYSSEDIENPDVVGDIAALASGETLNIGGWTLSCKAEGDMVTLTATAGITNSGMSVFWE